MEKNEKKRSKLSIVLAALVIVFALVSVIAVIVSQVRIQKLNKEIKKQATEISNLLTNKDVPILDVVCLMDEIRDIGELATVEYCYTNAAPLSEPRKLTNTDVDIPLSTKKVLITMDGVLKAGVDVNQVKIDCDETTKTIYVKIPKAKIVSNELLEESFHVWIEKDGMFNKVTLNDGNNLRAELKEKAEEKAKEQGVLKKAQENAQAMIRSIIEATPSVKDNYTIQFK